MCSNWSVIGGGGMGGEDLWNYALLDGLKNWQADHRAGKHNLTQCIQLLSKTENARLPKLSQNCRKTSENYKTRENAFDKTRERLFFGKFSASFRTIFEKF